ncbi:hypothetical protein [Rhodococcus sp. OK302]|nr:hypothetical protein [Rhodococcus sp. OK302]
MRQDWRLHRDQRATEDLAIGQGGHGAVDVDQCLAIGDEGVEIE